MNYWLFKSEPHTWSWDDQVAKGTEHWDGVRNYQATNFMKDMKKGDRGFFYHSGKDREIVGLVEVAKEYYPDHTDASGRFGMVDIKALKPVETKLSLPTIKADPSLADMVLVKNSRLSVQPVTKAEWDRICDLAGVKI